MPPIIKDKGEAESANVVSLVGGIIVAAGVFALVLLLMGRVTPAALALAGVIAAAVGAFVRIADL